MLDRIVLRDLLGGVNKLEQLAWAPFREGVSIVRLHGNGADGPAAALLKYEPGASVPAHEHADFEHIFVLTGEQSDLHGSYGAGTLLISPPGSSHRVTSAQGCVVLAVWAAPVRFL